MNLPSDDLDRIMAVMAAAFDPAFGEAWTRRQVEDALLFGNCHYALLTAEGREPGANEEAAAFFLSRTGVDEEELLLIGVTPMHRRRGLASRLVERLAADAKDRGAERLLLEMRRGNPAQSLYIEHGFYQIGERPKYYRTVSGERLDAMTFAKDL